MPQRAANHNIYISETSIFRQGQGVKEERRGTIYPPHNSLAKLDREGAPKGSAASRVTSDDADNAEIAKKRRSYLSPKTSCMSYSPGFCEVTHLAARTLPRENMSRVMARWEISIRSPWPMK